MTPRRECAAALLLALTAACANPAPAVDAALTQNCLDLIEAPPDAWADLLPGILARGPDATSALAASLRTHPEGSGVQAVLFALGRTRDPAALPVLEGWLTGGAASTEEAALALGTLGERRATNVLSDVVDDHSVPIRTRAAAACALLDLGDVQRAVPMLSAVLLAATPDGAALGRELGLPDQTRWAVERWMVIEAIRRHTGGESFGLDPDAPWPTLSAGVDAMRAALGG